MRLARGVSMRVWPQVTSDTPYVHHWTKSNVDTLALVFLTYCSATKTEECTIESDTLISKDPIQELCVLTSKQWSRRWGML